MRRLALVLAVLCAPCLARRSSFETSNRLQPPLVVNTTCGPVRGTDAGGGAGGVRAWFSIPYAAPPLGGAVQVDSIKTRVESAPGFAG
jgi:hypothetical protein